MFTKKSPSKSHSLIKNTAYAEQLTPRSSQKEMAQDEEELMELSPLEMDNHHHTNGDKAAPIPTSSNTNYRNIDIQASRKQNTSAPSHDTVYILDYVDPLDNVRIAINAGLQKAKSTSLTSTGFLRVILKAMMSGSYLGFCTTLTLTAISVGWDKVSAALLFPMGFVLLILMGNDLATGNFALLPMAYLAERKKLKALNKAAKQAITVLDVLTNWLVVYVGNFMGALLYLLCLYGANTHFGKRERSEYDAFRDVLCSIAESKTLGYKSTGGGAGWFASVFNGILCNWMVTMGVLLSLSSRSTVGKIFAMYIPITLFITLGFEHSIVNLFVLPAGLAYECDTYTAAEWWLWNQIPVTLGNIFAGVVLTAMCYFFIWSPKL